MKLIERAAKRLEELRLAGLDLGDGDELAPDPGKPANSNLKDQAPDPQEKPAAALAKDAPEEPSKKRTVQPGSVTLDLDAMSASGFVSPKVARSLLADEYRVIKRPLIANALGKSAAPIPNGNLIMVTSALPGEGKTFTAINLAMSIAMELDSTVMLVDADVARPSVFNVLGLPPARGLLDVLLDKSLDLSEVLLKTNVERLSLLPSGVMHDRATELLASDAMTALLDEMSTRYPDRIIVFDSPPILLTTESTVLASHMGQVVIVVHAETTSQRDVKQALAAIEQCPIKLLVLNQARTSSPRVYGYGHGE